MPGDQGGFLHTLKGYSDNPYVQQLFKSGLQKAEGQQSSGGSMSPFPNVQLPSVNPAADSVDRLAWLRAFGVQG
jgi:hypothetical protein